MRELSLKDSSSSSRGNNLTEKELIHLVRRKDPAGMRCFYNRYVGYLTAVCSRYVVDPSSVKDVLQESFLKMFSHFNQFEYRGDGSLKAWATRIVVNQALNHLRGKGRLTCVEALPDLVQEEEDFQLPEIPAAVLQDMIRQLPDGYRTVFNLFVFEKKSHREIASMLGIKEDTSASQLFRARAQLTRTIKAYIKEHEDG